MSSTALLLTLLSACAHAGWNLLLKAAPDPRRASLLAGFFAGLLQVPVALVYGLPDQSLWIILIASITLEVCYFKLLGRAYQIGDFSLVYPFTRGAAVLLLALFCLVFLGESPSASGWLGILAIALGLIFITGTNKLKVEERRLLIYAPAIALLIALCGLLDGTALRRGADPIGWNAWLFVGLGAAQFAALVQSGGVTRSPLGRAAIVRIAAAALLIPLGYMLALAAFAHAKIAYAGACREISVVLAVLAGFLFFGERLGRGRLLGALTIAGGALILAFYG